MKRTFFTEVAYVFGIVILAAGTAFMEKADLGMSMVVAPAYLLHLKISRYFPVFSFGMAEYTLQAVLLLALIIILRKFKKSYLFSFVTAVLYGLTLDGAMLIVAPLPCDGWPLRILFYALGMLICAMGISLFFHTYISPEVYELWVKEISAKQQLDINRVKTVYDCTSCVVSIIMSFAFFGLWNFEGVKIGTIVSASLNGFLIGKMTVLFERFFEFKDGMPFRKYFES